MAAAEGIIFIDITENCEMMLRTLSLVEVRRVPLVCLHGSGITKPTDLIFLKDKCLECFASEGSILL
jgi:hypothetical protein